MLRRFFGLAQLKETNRKLQARSHVGSRLEDSPEHPDVLLKRLFAERPQPRANSFLVIGSCLRGAHRLFVTQQRESVRAICADFESLLGHRDPLVWIGLFPRDVHEILCFLERSRGFGSFLRAALVEELVDESVRFARPLEMLSPQRSR